ncbi:MAG: glycosyltransferase [Candidatus Latescibacterota bacterium]
MKLSVIIPAHGREELLVLCLKSLDKCVQGNLDYEVCVIDDGSGIDEYGIREKSAVSCPLIWRKFSSPRGRSAARNEGIRATTGEIVVFLDSDMEAREKFLRAHEEIHCIQPHTVAIGKIVWPDSGGFLRYIGSRGIAKLKPGSEAPPWYFVTGNSSVERADLLGNSPFDETISGWGGEDLDLGMKMARGGVRFISLPEAESYHHFNGTLSEHLQRTRLYGSRSVPVLIGRYPELQKTLRLDVLKSPFWRLLTSPPIYSTLALAAQAFDFLHLPAQLYDYLTFTAYSRGWREREKP